MEWKPIPYKAHAFRDEKIVPGSPYGSNGVIAGKKYVVSRAHICCAIHKTELIAVTGIFADSLEKQTKLYYPTDVRKILRIQGIIVYNHA